MANISKIIVAIFLTLLCAHAVASPIGGARKILRRDIVKPLPARATADDKLWQPAVDFTRHSCYNTAAISPEGEVNPGLEHNFSNGPAEDCRDTEQLDNNNVYSRKRCNHGWCAYVYDYYFEKDVGISWASDVGGHRHDWEHIVVFVKEDRAQFVAISRHGHYDMRRAEDVEFLDGTHPKVVYHKDGGLTHCWRWTKDGDTGHENERREWLTSSLVSYNGFPSRQLRDKLFGSDFGKARMAISDRYFQENLDSAKNIAIKEFDSRYDDESSPGNPLCDELGCY
ncbi:hypothetical protein M426DRAFT_14040 [Hypoxylon sp. CI-4A]|nr:hypothetical protein M426DRAFT_14040 [Hypoxylon sp. CI-4A]